MNLSGYQAAFDVAGANFMAYTMPSYTLKAGASVYLCENSTCGGSDRLNIGKNIYSSPGAGTAVYLCAGTCSTSTLRDVLVISGSKTIGTYHWNAKFTPSQMTGITSANETTLSYIRKAYSGLYPNFVAADWTIGTKTK